VDHQNDGVTIPQYSLGKIVWIWAAAAIPMGILGWMVAPALAHDAQRPASVRLAVLTAGLIWQFILVLILIYPEAGSLRWQALWPRLWLNSPRSPQTGEPHRRLWWWLIPVILLTAILEMMLADPIDEIWLFIFPFLAEPAAYSLQGVLATPEAKAQLVGSWDTLLLFVLSALFNTVIGEELLFRGVLLPRMAGVFGKWDWVMNGLLFALYHLHQPWSLLSTTLEGIFLFALPSRYFRSAWFGIIAHSGQSVFITILVLGLVLGLA
jgi:uncharacterized protein